MATAQDVLNLARSQLGVSENPLGSNRGTPYHAWFGAYSQGWQWCAIFVCWVFSHVDPALIHGLHSAYSGDYLNSGRGHGEEITAPVPGAIAIMDYGDGGITDHIGIVESVGGGKMVLIEGNHNNRVERVTRQLGGSTRFWYVLPKYSQAKPKPQEAEVSTQSSAGRVKSFEGIYQIGIMDGRPWDVWAKAQNPTGKEITVTVVATTNNASKGKAYPLAANQILEVQIGKAFGAAGNTLVTIEPSVPAVCTLDHRPT